MRKSEIWQSHKGFHECKILGFISKMHAVIEKIKEKQLLY